MTSPHGPTPRDSIQVHWLTAYPASCLVRGDDGRPKTLVYGDVERARLSSASVKRAVRTSELFVERFESRLGTRTRRIGDLVLSRLVQSGVDPVEAQDAVTGIMATHLASLGAPDDRRPGWIKQLAFVAEREIAAMVEAARALIEDGATTSSAPAQGRRGARAKETKQGGDAALRNEQVNVLRTVTGSVDVALFGRFFAKDRVNTMVGACEVAHPFTVGRAVLESDFYVAVDDHADSEDDTAGGFLGESFFTSGLFYGYARIDLRQLRQNLGGDAVLANDAAAAMVEALLTVSPRGKVTSHGSHSLASWAMVERGPHMPSSLAAAFLRPVTGDDHLQEAVTRAESLSAAMERAYGATWNRRVLNLAAGSGSLAGLLEVMA